MSGGFGHARLQCFQILKLETEYSADGCTMRMAVEPFPPGSYGVDALSEGCGRKSRDSVVVLNGERVVLRLLEDHIEELVVVLRRDESP